MSYNGIADNELMNRIAAGDGNAFTELYNRYWNVLYITAYKVYPDTSFAEDVVQDVFTNVWALRENLKVDQVKSYLFACTRYAILKVIRKNRYVEISDHADLQLAGDISGEELFDIRVLEKTIALEVSKLPDKCRLIFRYSREAGLTHGEIAEKMDISTNTVKVQLNRALKKIKGSLSLLAAILWLR